MRKRPHPEPENHERWLVSYADFITLLFAFFVVMFASSQTDRGKAQQVSDSVKEALEGRRVSSLVATILGGAAGNTGQGNAMHRGPGGAVAAETAPSGPAGDGGQHQLLPSLEILAGELEREIREGQLQVSMQPRGLVISFTQAALFPSGEDLLSPGAYQGLAKVAAAILRLPNPVRLEGHTDAQPIRTVRFQSNWDLSAARSIALLKVLTERFHVPPGQLSVAGYADTAPLAANDTETGRARNRRVDIVVLNEQGGFGEPMKMAAPVLPAPAPAPAQPTPPAP